LQRKAPFQINNLVLTEYVMDYTFPNNNVLVNELYDITAIDAINKESNI